jgi:transposase
MPRASRKQWEKRVQRWQKSGLSADEFASRSGVSCQSLRSWKWKLNREARSLQGKESANGAERADSPPRFIELATRTLISEQRFELILTDGRRLLIPTGFDVTALSELLSVLGEQR